MAETLINNNQLNLGDLSGAYVELSQIVTAGKKKIVESLTAKGVTNITYTDTLTKMSEGIDALETNGVGGVNPNFPIVISDSTYSMRSSEYYLQIIGNYLSGYNGNYIRVFPIPTSLNTGSAPVTGKVYYSADIKNSTAWVVEDEQTVTYDSSYCCIRPMFGSSIVLGRKYLYMGGTCRVIIDLDDDLNITSASARNMQTEGGIVISSSVNSSVRILATNYDKDIAIVYWPKNSAPLLKVTLSTGVYEPINITGLGVDNISEYSKQIDLNTSIVLSSPYQTKTIYIVSWNWDSIENSQVYTFDATKTSGPFMYGKATTQSGSTTLFIASRISDTQLKLWNYSYALHTIHDTTITVSGLSRLSNVLYSSSNGYIYEGLAALYTDLSGHVLLSWGTDYAYLNYSGNTPQQVSYVKDSSLTSALSCYGWTSSQGSTATYTFMPYIDKTTKKLYFINSNNSQIYFNSLDIVYNKVLATVVRKNGYETIYKNSTIITRDNIAAGGPFDATNITIQVDVSTD